MATTIMAPSLNSTLIVIARQRHPGTRRNQIIHRIMPRLSTSCLGWPDQKPNSVGEGMDMTYEQEATLERKPGASAYLSASPMEYDLTTSSIASLATLDEQAATHHGCDAWVEHTQSSQDLMLWACDVLRHSPCARAILKEVAQSGWAVGLTQLDNDGYNLDSDNQIIYLDDHGFDYGIIGRSTYLRHRLMMSFVRALRDKWHDTFDDKAEAYTPEAILMRERLITAEIETFAVQCAWELRSAGYSTIWRYMIGSQDGDLAMGLSCVLEREPSGFMDAQALAHVIRQWFKTPSRIAAADHRALEYMDDVLRWREDRCQTPFGERTLTSLDVIARTTLPESGSYIGEAAHLVLADARHYGLQNPINKVHFDHIKHDTQASVIADVPFRDPELGRRIFSH